MPYGRNALSGRSQLLRKIEFLRYPSHKSSVYGEFCSGGITNYDRKWPVRSLRAGH